MPERHELLIELLQAVHRSMFDRIKDLFEVHGLPAASMFIIRHVHMQPGITLSEVARRSGLAKSHVSKTVDGLVAQGFLEKRPDPADQRLVRLHITELAERHFAQMKKKVRERMASVVAALPDEKVAAVIDGLQALQAVLAEKPAPPPNSGPTPAPAPAPEPGTTRNGGNDA